MTGKEFLWQYIMIVRKIRSVKLQLDSMIALANTSAMQDHLQSKIDDLTNSLKLIVDNGNLVKMQMTIRSSRLKMITAEKSSLESTSNLRALSKFQKKCSFQDRASTITLNLVRKKLKS